jgi:glycine cleavage system H protein
MRKVLNDVWVEINGVLEVGITKNFLEDSGDITFINFQVVVGDEVNEGDVIASLETVKSVVELKSPVKGKIVEINTEVADNPDKINDDPEGVWLVKIEAPEDVVKKLKEG